MRRKRQPQPQLQPRRPGQRDGRATAQPQTPSAEQPPSPTNPIRSDLLAGLAPTPFFAVSPSEQKYEIVQAANDRLLTARQRYQDTLQTFALLSPMSHLFAETQNKLFVRTMLYITAARELEAACRDI
jgi:hypothetical protein